MGYQVEWHADGVRARLSDVLRGTDLLALVCAVCEDARFDNLRYCIVDATDIDGLQVDDEHFTSSCATLIGAAFTNAHVVVAVISTHAACHALCGRMVEMRVMPFPPAVFPALDMALRWIGAELPARGSPRSIPKRWLPLARA